VSHRRRSAMDKRGCCRGPSSRGFTLVEVMIALVITSMLVSVLVSALYYVFRVQDMLRGEVIERESSLRAKAWFIGALRACLPAEKSSESAFSGRALEIRCETMEALEPRRVPVTARIVFALRRAEGNAYALAYAEQGKDAANPRTIAGLPEGEAAFRFVDANGNELDRWPPDRSETEALPSLIKLSIKNSAAGDTVWLVAPRADPWLPPVPKNLLGIPIPR